MKSFEDHEVLSKSMRLGRIRLEHKIFFGPIKLEMIYDVKYDDDGKVVKYKARLVVKGHGGNMIQNIHFGKTYSITPSSNTLRLFCALTILHGFKRSSFDKEVAHLNTLC